MVDTKAKPSDALFLTEYSADLQLRVLGVCPDELQEPILDLGCGSGAALVRHLRDLGKGAIGLDRTDSTDDFVISADWLDHPLGSDAWGTILTHMAWSNRFLQHHVRADGHPERYARRYLEILEALKPGGSFLYSPGLPFIEIHLSRDLYDVRMSELPELSGSPFEKDLRARYGATVLYSARITRLHL